MRILVTLIATSAALLTLAAVMIGLAIGASHGRPSVLLIAVFAIDSVAILVIAWKLIARRESRTP